MVEILIIKKTKFKNIEGIVYAILEARAEAFAYDTTLFMTLSESNLRHQGDIFCNSSELFSIHPILTGNILPQSEMTD